MKKYNPQKIEKKWQKYWAENKSHETPDEKEGMKNKYVLVEFPYPSGNLHIGHWYAYSIPDIYVRWLKMKGEYNVMYPFGFDAFGLPAENAAIKRNLQPKEWTESNIKYMTEQLNSIGASFDWSRKVNTTDPSYYKWTQWIFTQFYKNNLAYKKEVSANWCPSCRTVLAREQVINGLCERCDSEVTQRKIPQWMFRITDYSDRLINDLDDMNWPEVIKIAQKNWIGRTKGAEIDFKLNNNLTVSVFTTRPDTIFGATYLVLAPEHPAVKELSENIENFSEVNDYAEKAKNKTELQRTSEAGKEKTGVELKGIKAINPVNGEEIPVWIADYVLGGYGTGAIMAVPAHDERDFEFSQKYNLSVVQVVEPVSTEDKSKNLVGECWTGEGVLINSENYNGKKSEEARKEIGQWLEKEGLGRLRTTYRLRDWTISRQRYWGVPIPMIYCEKCGHQPVPENELPVELPYLEDFRPSDEGMSPLARMKDWVKTNCPKCGSSAERETDTMDTFVDSSWYFIRYTDPNNNGKIADGAVMGKWLPVDLYFGGAEHTTMHLLYSRFFTKALKDLGIIDFDEPFTARINRGLIMGPDGQKMSKSRGNVIDPDKQVEQYGADAVRMFLAFMGPYEQGGLWSETGINGVDRFLKRVWKMAHSNFSDSNVEDSDKAIHVAIRNIGKYIFDHKFNTGVSELMKLLNEFEKNNCSIDQYEKLLIILAPFAPHITEEIWQEVLKNKGSIHFQKWPEYDQGMVQKEALDLVIQVNGKTRDTINIMAGLSEKEVTELALKSEKVANHTEGKDIKRVVYIKDRLVNIVV